MRPPELCSSTSCLLFSFNSLHVNEEIRVLWKVKIHPKRCNFCTSGCWEKHSLFFLLSVNSGFLIHGFGCCRVNILWRLPSNVFGCLVYSWSVPIYFISFLDFPLQRSLLLGCLVNLPPGRWHQQQQRLCRCTGTWLARWILASGPGLGLIMSLQ